MLTRAARRRQALQCARNVAQQIELPFLCPALAFSHITRLQQRPISSRSLTKPRKSIPQSPQSRQLASAAPLPESQDDYASYIYSQDPRSDSRRRVSTTVPDWDPTFSRLIHIDASTAVAHVEKINTGLQRDADIQGNSSEVEDHLEACVMLKKWPRAVANLAQLKILYQADLPRLQTLYNYVLAAMVDEWAETSNPEMEERIVQWIERDLKHAGLAPDAQTLALVLKSALAVPSRSKRDRTVRRYWDMAKRLGLHGEVAGLRDVLSERDLGFISQICPLDAEDFAGLVSEASLADGPDIVLSENVLSERPGLDIRETEQKGQGMAALKKTLSLFNDEKDQTRLRIQVDADQRAAHAYERQARLEHDAVTSATERWKSEHEKMARRGITMGLSSGRIGVLLWQWHVTMREKIIAEIKRVEEAETKVKKTQQDKRRIEYGPFLQQLEPEKLAAVVSIAMMQIMNKAGATRPVKLVRLVTELGRLVESEKHTEIMHKRAAKWDRSKKQGVPAAEIVQHLMNEPDRPNNWGVTSRGTHPGSQMYLRNSEWTTSVHVKLGAILAEMFMDTAKFTQTHKNETTGKTTTIAQPVFKRQWMFLGGKKIGTVALHEDFVGFLVKQPNVDMVAKQLPMVCPPLPWKDFDEGGYLETQVPALRVKHKEVLQKDYVQAAASTGDLDQVFAGLDVLGKVPWKINKDIFEVMIKAWNTGEEIAGLAPLNREVEIPERPPSDAPSFTKHEWFSRMREIDNQKNGDHSERCFQNLQMEIAKAYLNETFYLPHNMDFRGRAYPIPPYLNQMGADNSRGLLLFGKGRKLGTRGLWWLKIHLSNVYGYDKASLSDRAQFPIDHIEEIRDSVADPLGGKKWWLGAEDPWQCLATCQELVKALDSPVPEEFISHLPVHQDGSCNGLQHYAALGGDAAGARQVNLEPGDKPADVYTGVCDLVAADIAVDAKAGHEMAKLLDGRLKRKIVKQTVMTNVYGVTFIGAAAQVRKQIDALLPDMLENRQSARAALYVAEKIFKALGALFTGAHNIQYWLGDCANRISSSLSPAQLARIELLAEKKIVDPGQHSGRRQESKESMRKEKVLPGADFRSSVIWTTPLKLPVVQPYRKTKANRVVTNLQQITLYEPTVADSVDKRKQLQAFPPNFIHSLDATHMVLSALKSDELGLSFTAVHDSFWTHAADIDTMSRLLRDAFIRMHSEDIVGRLAAEFRKRYEGHLYMAQIGRNSKLTHAIKKYRTEYSAELGGRCSPTVRKNFELLREIKKRRLLASEDPEERAEGARMVTAATLFEDFDGEKYLVSKDSLGKTAMASMPKTSSEKATIEAALESDHASEASPTEVEDLDNDAADMADIGEEPDDEVEASHVAQDGFEEATGRNKGRPKKKWGRNPSTNNNNNHTWLWLPLTFRPVPKKGDFDVQRLRDSQYFFS